LDRQDADDAKKSVWAPVFGVFGVLAV